MSWSRQWEIALCLWRKPYLRPRDWPNLLFLLTIYANGKEEGIYLRTSSSSVTKGSSRNHLDVSKPPRARNLSLQKAGSMSTRSCCEIETAGQNGEGGKSGVHDCRYRALCLVLETGFIAKFVGILMGLQRWSPCFSAEI